jgi:hypothetical protein
VPLSAPAWVVVSFTLLLCLYNVLMCSYGGAGLSLAGKMVLNGVYGIHNDYSAYSRHNCLE